VGVLRRGLRRLLLRNSARPRRRRRRVNQMIKGT
jgi:hypothetical protein